MTRDRVRKQKARAVKDQNPSRAYADAARALEMPKASQHPPAEVPATVAVMMARQLHAAWLHLIAFETLAKEYGKVIPEWTKLGEAPRNPVHKAADQASSLLYELREWAGRTAHASGAVEAVPNGFGGAGDTSPERRAETALYPPGEWCRVAGGTMPQLGEERQDPAQAPLERPVTANLQGPVPEKRFSARASGRDLQPAFPAVDTTPAAAVWQAERTLYRAVCQHWESPGDTPADLAASLDGLEDLADTFTSACTHTLDEVRRRIDDGLLVGVDETAFDQAADTVRAQLGIQEGYVAKLAYALSQARTAMNGAAAALPRTLPGQVPAALTRTGRALDGKPLAHVRDQLGSERHLQRLRSKTRMPEYRQGDAIERVLHWMHAAGAGTYDHARHLADEQQPTQSGLPLGTPRPAGARANR
ncbi:hypothetical protein ACH4FX_37505 [Streptomyces sp. NPDC018019]|uniref:hypothetical protein n=1 Tax=Streptomyces sp. NPDC018019 TaxID=3365030 RepID=UPI003787EE15